MRLTTNNIAFVKELRINDMSYSWYVALKSNRVLKRNRVSNTHNYVNYEDGKTVVKEYPMDRLPKSVQKFIADKMPENIREDNYNGMAITEHIYR